MPTFTVSIAVEVEASSPEVAASYLLKRVDEELAGEFGDFRVTQVAHGGMPPLADTATSKPEPIQPDEDLRKTYQAISDGGARQSVADGRAAAATADIVFGPPPLKPLDFGNDPRVAEAFAQLRPQTPPQPVHQRAYEARKTPGKPVDTIRDGAHQFVESLTPEELRATYSAVDSYVDALARIRCGEVQGVAATGPTDETTWMEAALGWESECHKAINELDTARATIERLRAELKTSTSVLNASLTIMQSERWTWMTDWCKRNSLSPWDNAVWAQAAEAWEQHLKETK